VKLLASGHTADGVLPSSWRVHPAAAANGLWSTADDLARFIIEVQRAKAGESKLLSKERATEFLTPGFTELALGPRIFGEGDATRFTQVGTTEGFEAVMVGYLDGGRGAVVLTNGEGGVALAQEILLAIAKEYGWPDYAPRPAKRIEPEVLNSYTGKYEFPETNLGDRALPKLTVDAYVENGTLTWAPEGLEPRPLYGEAKDQFFALDGAPGVTFERDEKGRVVTAIVRGGGLERKGTRKAAAPAP
jgi:hypothetical protein